VGNPFGEWNAVGGEIIGSGAGGAVVLFDAGQEMSKPLRIGPEETFVGPQSLVAAATNGLLFASAGPSSSITLYARESFRERPKRVRCLYAGPGAVRALAFTTDGRELAAATLQGEIVAWNANNGTEVLRLGLKNMGSSLKEAIPTSLAFEPERRFLAIGTGLDRDGKVVIIDLNKRALANIIDGEQLGDNGGVTSVSYAMKGEFLLVELDHRHGAILESGSGKRRQRLRGTLVPSSDGEWLGVLTEENLKDPETRPEIKPVRDFVRP
jgi:WD40 repeat protein